VLVTAEEYDPTAPVFNPHTPGDAFEPHAWARVLPQYACRNSLIRARTWHPVVALEPNGLQFTLWARYRRGQDARFHASIAHFEVRLQADAPHDPPRRAYCEAEQPFEWGRHSCALEPGHAGGHRCACDARWE
jgi:hypothetical protein